MQTLLCPGNTASYNAINDSVRHVYNPTPSLLLHMRTYTHTHTHTHTQTVVRVLVQAARGPAHRSSPQSRRTECGVDGAGVWAR